MNFLSSIISNSLELIGWSFQRLTNPPNNPTNGVNYFDTVRNANGLYCGFWDYSRYTPVSVSTNTAIQHKQLCKVNTSVQSVTLTFPASPIEGFEFVILDTNGTFKTLTCTLNFNGKTFRGSGTLVLNVNWTVIHLIYLDNQYYIQNLYLGVTK